MLESKALSNCRHNMRQNIKCFLITVFLIAIYSIHVHAADPMLKWDASTGDVSGYKIYYGLSHGNYPFSEDVGNVTQYSLSNFSLSESTTYYFVVRAYNASGESGDSNVTTYSVPDSVDSTPPFSPQGVAGDTVNNDIVLTWKANSESDFSVYRVYYGTSSRIYGLPIPVNGTKYSISELNTGVTYYFAVTAVDASGNESGYSSEITKNISLQTPTSIVQTVTNVVTNTEEKNLPSFDKPYYLSAKLAQLQASDSNWIGKTVDDLESFLNSVGFTAESHYSQYGYLEGLEPNQYFNHSEYIRAKATAIYYSDGYPSVDDAVAAFNAAWPYDAYKHYLLYGAAEGINPSNSFDESAYLADKLSALRAEGSDWDNKTIDDLRSLFNSLGMTALDHYLTYGQLEGLSVTPVPAK